MKLNATLLVLLLLSSRSFAQNHADDSSQVVKMFHKVLQHCREASPDDPKAMKPGSCGNAAPYIVYRGEDKVRKWKDVSNYSNGDEQAHVDELCSRINNTVNRDPDFRVTEYFTKRESEGTWHVLIVSYKYNGEIRKALFAFLFIKGRYALGDIDWSGQR